MRVGVLEKEQMLLLLLLPRTMPARKWLRGTHS
jgi:hypothetical protein